MHNNYFNKKYDDFILKIVCLFCFNLPVEINYHILLGNLKDFITLPTEKCGIPT